MTESFLLRRGRFERSGGLRIRGAGFTLIEVLVTLVILSTGLVLVLRAFNTSFLALAQSRDTLRASHLLETRLAAFERQALETGGAPAGGLERSVDGFRLETRLSRVLDAGMAAAAAETSNVLYRVTVTALKENTGRTYSADTYMRFRE